jgi:hypothetical protein
LSNDKPISIYQIIQGLCVGVGIVIAGFAGRELLALHDFRVIGNRCTGATCDEIKASIQSFETWRTWHVRALRAAEEDITFDIHELQRRVERLDDDVFAGRTKPPMPEHYDGPRGLSEIP